MKDLDLLSEIIFEKPERIKEPYSWVQHIPFAFFLIDILRPELVVELGVHTGNSFCSFCQAVKKLGLNTTCYGVDTWLGDDQAGLYEEGTYNDLSSYVNEKYGENAKLLKMTFDEAANLFDDRSIDLLHIDGLHTYEAVKRDFETWLPKLSEKGIVILHDISFRESDFGVWKFWEEISQGYESTDFEYGYGLGLVVVGKEIEDSFKKALDEIRHDAIYGNIFRKLGESIFNEAIREKKPLTKLYIDFGEGYSEELSIFTDSGMEAGYINLNWDLNKLSKRVASKNKVLKIKGLRWDPLEKWCKVKLESASYQDNTGRQYPVEISSITSNGKSQDDGWIAFETFDPMFFFPVPGNPVLLNIKGKLELLSDTYIDERFREKEEGIRSKDIYIQKIESELSAIKKSFIWQLYGFFKKIT